MLRSADLTPDEIALAAQYLHDRESQCSLAAARGVSQTTLSGQLRRIMTKLEHAGFDVKRPKRRTSKPPWVPDKPVTVIIDPDTISRMCVNVDASGVIHGKFNGFGDRAEAPTDAEFTPKRFS